MGKCGVNIGLRSEFEGKFQFMTQIQFKKHIRMVYITVFYKKIDSKYMTYLNSVQKTHWNDI